MANYFVNARHVADLGQFPHVGLIAAPIGENNAMTYLCGASILSNYIILTAAHCLIYDLHYTVNVLQNSFSYKLL